MVQNENRDILLVEDSLTDAQLAIRAFSKCSVTSNIYHARDGVEAMAMLRREGEYVEQPRPDLIFLDLNMPRLDGRQVLDQIRNDPNLLPIPVVVLSTSGSDDDISDAYQLGCNSYVVKPVDLSEFFQVIESVQSYWFQICALPEE